MTDPFDWAGLWEELRWLIRRGQGGVADHLRERIEAAFVPKEWRDCQVNAGRQLLAEATARAEAAEAENAKLREALECIIASTHSHLDGRDLLAEMHPRKTLDVKRRVDGRETWFEGDWLSELWAAVKDARAALERMDDDQ